MGAACSRQFLQIFNYNCCKIVFLGKNMLERNDLHIYLKAMGHTPKWLDKCSPCEYITYIRNFQKAGNVPGREGLLVYQGIFALECIYIYIYIYILYVFLRRQERLKYLWQSTNWLDTHIPKIWSRILQERLSELFISDSAIRKSVKHLFTTNKLHQIVVILISIENDQAKVF
jgi:hypothetical protein